MPDKSKSRYNRAASIHPPTQTLPPLSDGMAGHVAP